MRYLCINCSYIYDEALGDETDGIDAGTCIDQIDYDVHCPGCDGSFEDFSPIEDEIIYVENRDRMTHAEREHLPRITYKDSQRVEVCIWDEEELHPSGEDHRVTAIYLVDDEWHIIEELFIMIDEDPVAEFDISGLDSFEIRASCSQHWLWSSWIIEGEQ